MFFRSVHCPLSFEQAVRLVTLDPRGHGACASPVALVTCCEKWAFIVDTPCEIIDGIRPCLLHRTLTTKKTTSASMRLLQASICGPRLEASCTRTKAGNGGARIIGIRFHEVEKKIVYHQIRYMAARLSIGSWGPAAWTIMHATSFAYPVHPEAHDRERMYEFLVARCGNFRVASAASIGKSTSKRTSSRPIAPTCPDEARSPASSSPVTTT